MSLTITGQLNRLIMAWDDGHSGIYYGIDSVNTSSRFSFLGEAAATPWLKFGFEIMLEGEGTSASNRVSQAQRGWQLLPPPRISPRAVSRPSTTPNSDSFFGDARRVAAWVEHKEIGRLTVGRYETAGCNWHHRSRRCWRGDWASAACPCCRRTFLRLGDGSMMSNS
jgi:hypothetical protein